MNKVKKGILLLLGGLTLIAGVVGIILPLLPTTPFLLLSAACFLRSSKRAHRFLMTNRLLGPYLYQYRVTKKIPKKAKYRAIILLWLSILLSSYLSGKLFVFLFLFGIALAVTIHLISIRTMNQQDYQKFIKEYSSFVREQKKN